MCVDVYIYSSGGTEHAAFFAANVYECVCVCICMFVCVRACVLVCVHMYIHLIDSQWLQ